MKKAADDFTMKVFVRTKKVAVRLSRINELYVTPIKTFRGYRTVLQYEDKLDGDQWDYVENAKELARQLGLSLQVVDLAKENIFSRLRQKGRSVPSAILPRSVFLGRRIIGSKDELENWSSRVSDEKVYGAASSTNSGLL